MPSFNNDTSAETLLALFQSLASRLAKSSADDGQWITVINYFKSEQKAVKPLADGYAVSRIYAMYWKLLQRAA